MFTLFLAATFMRVVATVRAVCFYMTTFAFAAPLFMVMLAVYPFVMLFDKFRYVLVVFEMQMGSIGIDSRAMFENNSTPAMLA